MMLPRRTALHRSDAGYTLTELLVVLVILSLITAAIAPRILGRLDSSKLKAARLQLDSVSAAMDIFYIDMNRYPTKEEGLGVLLSAPEPEASWDGPYLRSKNNLIDPWGNPLALRFTSVGEPQIVSFGADKKEGGEGDASDLVFPESSNDG